MTCRPEARSRESTGQISVASPLLLTNSSQRGCVSQTISAAGNDSRNPATAGNVCTMSPREPRRTTIKRWSAMAPFSKAVKECAGRVALRIAHNGDADTKALGNCTFRYSFRGVIRAFGVHLRPQFLEQRFDIGLRK